MELPLWDIIPPETKIGSEDASKVIGKNTNTAAQNQNQNGGNEQPQITQTYQ